MLSIVTATYNRELLLPRLYESLVNQECQNFEWVVVDDGSVDNTGKLFNEWIIEKKINIKFIKKNNGGKHTALNLAFKESSFEFVLIVDSDDFLPANAVKIISEKILEFNENENNLRLSGMCFSKADFNGLIIGNLHKNSPLFCNYLDYRYKYNISGDKVEIFKRKLLLKFPFPEYEKEKFCPEALVWNRIAQEYDMVFYNDIVYLCEYQQDGLTSRIYEIRKNSPQATLQYYYELSLLNVPNLIKIRAILNYWRFYFLDPNSKNFINKPKGLISYIGKILIYFLHNLKLI